jgi:hypothetical protein
MGDISSIMGLRNFEKDLKQFALTELNLRYSEERLAAVRQSIVDLTRKLKERRREEAFLKDYLEALRFLENKNGKESIKLALQNEIQYAQKELDILQSQIVKLEKKKKEEDFFLERAEIVRNIWKELADE